MKTKKIALLLLVGSLIATVYGYAQEPPPYPATAGDEAQQGNDQAAQGAEGAPAGDPAAAGVDYFHSQLSPYGQWVARDGYGMVWVPNVNPGWRPYTAGHWAYTDQGWAWVGDERWGWAAYHYGRWYYDGGVSSWAWVPGYTWAPAWVDWRHGGGYLGWAPLPPSVGFAVGAGLIFGGVVISPGFYTFVGERNILAPRIGGFILPSGRNAVFVTGAGRITNYTMVNNRIVNVGVSSERIAQITGHPVNQVTIASMGGVHGAFYQPTVIGRAARVMPAEFGSNLSRQIAVQQKSRSYSVVAQNKFTPGGTSSVHSVGGSSSVHSVGGSSAHSAGSSSVHSVGGSSTIHSTGSTNGSHGYTKSSPSTAGPSNGAASSPSGSFKPTTTGGSQIKSTPPSSASKSAPPPPKPQEKSKKPPKA